MNSPDKSRASFAPGDPPPNYSACVAPTSGRSNDLEAGTGETVDPISEGYPLKGIHHHKPVSGHIAPANPSSAPFLGVPAGPGSDDNEFISPSNPYNPQPAYNPSYVAGTPQHPRPNVYGRKTIVLKRTDAEIAARRKKLLIWLCVGLLIGSIIPIGTLIWIGSMSSRHGKVKSSHKYNDDNDGQPRLISSSDTNMNPYSDSNYDNNYSYNSWKPKEIVTVANPFLEDNYKDKYKPKPQVEDNKDRDDDDLLRLGIDKEMKEMQDRIKATLDHVNGVQYPGGQHMFDFNLPGDDKTTKEPPLWK